MRPDNAHIQQCEEARQWPFYDTFKDALPTVQYASLEFDLSVKPGKKFTISCLSDQCVSVLRKFYILHTQNSIFLPSKFSSITWKSKN